MLWNIYGGGVPQAMAAAESASSRAATAVEQTDVNRRYLEDKIDTLALVCRAMWTLLEEKCGVTEKDLLARMEKLDLEDGKRDNKRRTPTKKCTRCGRALNARHAVCLYCGAAAEYDSAFDAV